MALNCGIVGLPNVGKSTLFNALTQTASAEAANYPFCTIEPNTGRVGVPDPRIFQLAQIAGSAQIIPVPLEIVDIAGLVRGASQGQGLGNQFLGHIREVDAILHVVRCFEDGDIVHVEGGIDPLRDISIIETELLIADMDGLEKRIDMASKKLKGSTDAALKRQFELMQESLKLLNDSKPARNIKLLDAEDEKLFKQIQLLTSKPILYVCNVRESEAVTGNKWTKLVEEKAKGEGAQVVIVSAAIEAEVASLEDEEERKIFLADLGLEETGLARVIRGAFNLLELMTFFTIGPKEAHGWSVKKGSKAPQAAGVIHTDFERGFICAETIAAQDYIACNGEQGAKTQGKVRLEGRDYLVKDGDVFHFRFNV
jgi:GTP-binding protein YchF